MSRSVIPRFELVVDRPEQAVADSLTRRLAAHDCACVGWVALPYAELHVPAVSRHFWSPRLQVTLDAHPDGTHLQCTFRPEPEVWTGFVFAHCLFLTCGVVGLSLGLAQWTIGQSPLALIAGGAGLALSFALYLGALFGHGLGDEQMHMLRGDLDRALGREQPAASESDSTA